MEHGHEETFETVVQGVQPVHERPERRIILLTDQEPTEQAHQRVRQTTQHMCCGFIRCQSNEHDTKTHEDGLNEEVEEPEPEELLDLVADVIEADDVEERQRERQRRHQEVRNL